MSEVYLNFLRATFVVIFLLVVDCVIEIILNRNVKNKKKSLKLRVLVRYVLFFCFLFFMAKIWVEGFGYLLTVVGVIAAALTITQKEYLMNLVGWLIIMWRDLFVEGDYIEIGKYSGFVKAIKPLYFSLEEGSNLSWGERTGKNFKIPNSFIAAHSIINYSADKNFIEYQLAFIFTFKSSLEKIQSLYPFLEKALFSYYKERYANWSKREQDNFEMLKKGGLMKPQFYLKVFQDKPSGIQLKIRYYALMQEQKLIDEILFSIVAQITSENPDQLGFSIAT